ncbi:MAG: copper amine oxidase N-terminal domain-containing protein, partial [Clostridia bacterium]|nr:copper amine oxidase N-terminal domain-containing protein [Clostridia bacterium]
MKKKILIPVITAAIMGFAAIGASARNLDMYVNNHHVVRDIQTVGRFDMLPVLDIAGELGFNCSFDGTTIKLYNDSRSYKFTMGKAAAYDQNGKWYGLDVVPQIINGSVRIPYKFFCDAMGLSYTWDDVTSTIFL